MTPVKVKFITVNGYSLINIRLLCYSLALLNLLVTAFVTLTIDLTVEEDPKVRVYARSRWLLLTCWFNMATIFYIILCIYCDWREKKGDETPLLDQLRRGRDFIMTSALFPVTAYADMVFWIFYKTSPWIIAPPRVLALVPNWAQHSLHTVSFVFVLMDLVLTPRQRPESDKKYLAVLYGFSSFYTFVMYVSYIFGDHVYAFLETASRAVCLQSVIISFLILTACYYAQWYVIDVIWGPKSIKLKRK